MPDAAPDTPPTRPDRPRWTWREWSAIAATLVTGVLLGPYVLRTSQPLPFVSSGGRVVAVGPLEAALQTQLAGSPGTAGSETVIGLSFQTAAGDYCRSFATRRGPAGLACRERGDWVIEILARNPRPRNGSAPAGYRQAGIPFPEVIRQAVAARISGDALTAEAEARAVTQKWRAERVLKDASP